MMNEIWGLPQEYMKGKLKLHDFQAMKAERVDAAQAMHDRALAEERNFTSAEKSQFDDAIAEIESLNGEIEKAQSLHKKLNEGDAGQLARSGFNAGFTPLKGTNMNTQQLSAGKLTAFSGPDGVKLAAEAGQWIRSLVRGDIRATMTEGDPTAGGYTVPAPMTRTIIDTRENVSVSRNTARVLPMDSETLSVPRLISGPAVSYVGEATAITPVDQVWGQLLLTCKKRAVLVKLSNELLGDSVVNLGEYVAQRAAYELAKQEDAEYIVGDATSAYGGESGLLNELGSAGIYDCPSATDTWAEIAMSDLTGTMGKLPSDYGDNTSWICSRQFYYSVMVRLMASAGGNDMVNIEAGSMGRPTFLGVPVFFSSSMPTATASSTVHALYGSFSESALIGDRVKLEVAVSPDKYFDEYCTALRIIARYDINVYAGGDDSNAGGYVGLKTGGGA